MVLMRIQPFISNARTKSLWTEGKLSFISSSTMAYSIQQLLENFPMPDYEIDAANKEVAVRLYGNAINEKYTKLLKENKDLSLEDCILLDTVQKGHRLNETDAKNLLERGLVEGEYPDLSISLSIARQTKQLPEYTKVKGLERDKIKQMALQFIQNAGEEGTRREFVIEYLRETLPARNTKEQNQRLVGNILAEMSNEGLVIQKDRNWYATTSTRLKQRLKQRLKTTSE
ncbi:MAG: hypothetical protein PUB31_01615 [Bacteroidales bacterium]|nr:hypothetical protein [Bacteroidales bacterium]